MISIERAREIPTIGNRVDIGCGACILGGVTVGDDCTIGANAVVIRDVPPRLDGLRHPGQDHPQAFEEGNQS